MYFPGNTDKPYLWWLPLPTMIVILVLVWLLMKRKEHKKKKVIEFITVPQAAMPATQPIYVAPIEYRTADKK
ncbi:hypothetical protein B9Z55_020440 [Caenorhabditis nigoni]|uniref:Uncharacterized protein n=1 Tax=Caenorhabditis nigoni TaxID=1611254 RepID=A0A2G5TNH7_9PELO|nr:hypothetical protein B9Z55_020440 [Caenorhabditis nigoni]